MFKHIKTDIKRHMDSYVKTRFKAVSLIELIQIILLNQGLHAIIIYRFGIFAKQQIFPVTPIFLAIHFILEKIINFLYGIHLSLKADIGAGFYIGHFGGIDIGECHIGKQVSIYQRVVIKANEEGIPTIEDKVWVGAHSHIIGPIIVQKNATIAAGAVVQENLPAACIAAGNPARVIKLNFDNSSIH